MWTSKLRDNYDNDFEQFEAFCETYGLLERLGAYESAEEAWADNPMIQGSTDPRDFGLVDARFEGEAVMAAVRRDPNHPLHDRLQAEVESVAGEPADEADDTWEASAVRCEAKGRHDLAAYVREFLAPGQ